MARKPRSVVAEVPHHVVHRGNNRRRLVSFASDYWRLLDMIGEASRKHACPVHAVALMSNHLHLIATPVDEGALGKFVKRFAQRYAAYRNHLREATGKLFEERFKSFTLRDDDYVATATAYIDLNPVRAGQLARVEAARWTSGRLHLGHPPAVDWPRSLWTPSPWYLGLGDDEAERAAAYREWLDSSERKDPEYVDELRPIEALSSLHYAHRLERPDGSLAREVPPTYRGSHDMG